MLTVAPWKLTDDLGMDRDVAGQVERRLGDVDALDRGRVEADHDGVVRRRGAVGLVEKPTPSEPAKRASSGSTLEAAPVVPKLPVFRRAKPSPSPRVPPAPGVIRKSKSAVAWLKVPKSLVTNEIELF